MRPPSPREFLVDRFQFSPESFEFRVGSGSGLIGIGVGASIAVPAAAVPVPADEARAATDAFPQLAMGRETG